MPDRPRTGRKVCVALRAERAVAHRPCRVVNECGSKGGPSVGARIVVSCYHPIYPVVVSWRPYWQELSHSKGADRAAEMSSWRSAKATSFLQLHASLPQETVHPKTKGRGFATAKHGDRLHVALFRERIFLHEPVHTFPDYESEDPCCNLVVRKSKVVGRDARSDRKLPL